MKGCKYTSAQVAETLEIMRLNGNNMTKTSKETGVSRTTLAKWKRLYLSSLAINDAIVVSEKTVVEQAVLVHDIKLEKKGAIIEKAMGIRMNCLERIEAIIKTETNMDRLGNCVKLMDSITGENADGLQHQEPIYIWQDLSQNLINLRHERENNRLKGDSA